MCSMYDLPALSIDTLCGSVSNPVTLCPASAKRSASGSPTYPQPIIPTLSWAPLKNSGFRSIGMGSVALLFICGCKTPGRNQGIRVFGDTVMRATLPPAGHRADVQQTIKYSRFGANKKRGTFSRWGAGETLIAGGARRRKIEGFESNLRADGRKAVRPP